MREEERKMFSRNAKGRGSQERGTWRSEREKEKRRRREDEGRRNKKWKRESRMKKSGEERT